MEPKIFCGFKIILYIDGCESCKRFYLNMWEGICPIRTNKFIKITVCMQSVVRGEAKLYVDLLDSRVVLAGLAVWQFACWLTGVFSRHIQWNCIVVYPS